MVYDNLKNNIETIKNNIKKALVIANRVDEVLLVGASKVFDFDEIKHINDECLLGAIGENRVQDLLGKYDAGKDLKWHFIGVLQSNKVKYLVDKVSLIQSVDRLSLAVEIDLQAFKHNLKMDVLVQVNMGCEASKSGFLPLELENGIAEMLKLKNVNVVGVMAVMPKLEEDELIELYKKLKVLYDDLKTKFNLKYLSAGMSNDYELAIIYAGANIVRVGRALKN